MYSGWRFRIRVPLVFVLIVWWVLTYSGDDAED